MIASFAVIQTAWAAERENSISINEYEGIKIPADRPLVSGGLIKEVRI